MNTNNLGQHIQQVAGSLGNTWNGIKGVFLNAFGYPKNVANDSMTGICSGSSIAVSDVLSYNGLRIEINTLVYDT